MSRTLARLLGCSLLVALVTPLLAREPEWLEIRSPHFSVVTDAGEKRGREVALRFEQMRAIFGTLLTKGNVTLPVPLQIVAFRNTKVMRQYAPLWKGKPVEVAGLFMGNSDRSFILLDMSVEDPWQVVFHEYAHQLLDGNNTGHVQPWFDEGFAEYFATIKISGKEAQIGLPSQNNALLVTHASLMKTADLFRVPHNSNIYNESGDHRSLFYAQSWLVVHYLFDNRLMAKTFRYFDLVDKGTPVEEAIPSAFGISVKDFDEAIRRYLRNNKVFYKRIPAPAGMDSAGYTAKPLAAADTKAVLADMHLHSQDYQEKAIAEFEEVLALQPDHPAALRGLGYAHLMRQDFQRAGEYFRKAAAGDSHDSRVLYYSALLVQREGGLGQRNGPEGLAVVQKQLETSVALDPEFADAYNLLAFTYAAQGQQTKALQTMLKAIALKPSDEGYSYNLSQMYLMNQKYDECIALLQPLTKSQNPQMSAQATQVLQQVQQVKLASAAVAMVEVQAGPDPGQQRLVVRKASEEPTPEANPSATAEVVTNPGPVRFVKGKLVGVDCSAPPTAILTVTAGTRTLKLHARDGARLVVIGADKLSCDWKNLKVAVNYRESGQGSGDVVSLELQ